MWKDKREIKLINQYYNLNNKGLLINKKKFKRIENPKVSIISAIYNSEKFILRFLRSIQNQLFNDIEIIFIDDYSDDNSTLIVEKYKKDDERIILIKNKKNKGTLISRNIGALKAKGEFFIFPDPDDMLSADILSLCYKISKRYNFDLIRFNMYSNRNFIFSLFDRNLKRIIYQPELRAYLIYGHGFKKLIDGIISNKFVRKTTFLIALNNIIIFEI
jgi:glycosyltransferase involved in cell wall biosynthesis